jgi:AcrR family transcriptional regulator
VSESGPGALTFAELADRAGLARPSVYEYFRSKGELVIALVDEEFPHWHAAIDAALERAPGPEGRIDAFVRTMLGHVASGRHHVPFTLFAAEIDEEMRAHVGERHARLLRSLRPSVAELGVADVDVCLRLLDGVLGAAIESLRRGGEPAGLIDAAASFALGGVRAMGDCSSRRREPAPRTKKRAAADGPAARKKPGRSKKTD